MPEVSNISTRSLQFYALARHWKSDLEFFTIETDFLKRLIEEHFVRLSDDRHINDLLSTGRKLLELQRTEKYLARQLDAQLTQLELMAEDIIPEDIDPVAVVQVELEKNISALTKAYRNVKAEIFNLVSSVMYKDKNV